MLIYTSKNEKEGRKIASKENGEASKESNARRGKHILEVSICPNFT
jgi:hypothetical protein